MPNNESQHRIVSAGLIKDFDSPEADAIIRLQTNIEFASVDKKISCYAITSAQEAEGKTTLTCNLAHIYAEKGLRVCLVDLDLRQPVIHKLFHIENKIGVVEYVKGDVDEISDIIHQVDNVDVITAGSHTPFPGKILGSPKMGELINKLRKEYDYVLLDTPPVLVVSDAYLIGPYVDGFLVVCSQHISYKSKVASAINSLEEKNINILGIVMTMVTTDEDNGKGGYGGYGYGYGYGYGNKYGHRYGGYRQRKEEQEDK